MKLRLQCLLVLCASLAGTAHAAGYVLSRLDAESDIYASTAAAINDRGVVVGQGYKSLGREFVPLVFSDGHTRVRAKEEFQGELVAINTSGLAVGRVFNRAHMRYALLRVTGKSSEVVDWPADWREAKVTGLNAQGDIVGSAATATGQRPFVYSNGSFRLLPLPRHVSSSGDGLAIDRHGDVYGSVWLSTGLAAYAWHRGRPEPLPDLGGGLSQILAVNASVDLVGWSRLPASAVIHAMRVSGGVATDLDGDADFHSEAHAVNDAGQVVGQRIRSGEAVGFLHDGAALHNLNDLLKPEQQAEWAVWDAWGIDNQGRIAAIAILRSRGTSHAVLLTPTPP